MRILFEIEADDIERVRKLVALYKNDAIVTSRIKRNIEKVGISPNKNSIWRVIVGCLLTTQQRSGPQSRVERFMRERSELFSFDACARKKKLASFAEDSIGRFGLRRAITIGKEIQYNYSFLANGGWRELKQNLKPLLSSPSPRSERKAANFISTNLTGFGCGFNWWMQHTRFYVRRRSVADEIQDADLLL